MHAQGLVAEWSCTGLQIRQRRFDSGRGLQIQHARHPLCVTCHVPCHSARHKLFGRASATDADEGGVIHRASWARLVNQSEPVHIGPQELQPANRGSAVALRSVRSLFRTENGYMATNNNSPKPRNFFRRWWTYIVGFALFVAAVLHYYKELRQVIPLLWADVQSARQYFNPPEQILTPKDVATAPSSVPSPSPPLTTQSLPTRAGPPCVSHTPSRILDVLKQAEGAHKKKFEKDYSSRTICSPGWFTTVVSVGKLTSGGTRLTLLSPTGPTIVADVGVLPAPLSEGDIVQVYGTVNDYQRKGFFAVGAIQVINGRAVRR